MAKTTINKSKKIEDSKKNKTIKKKLKESKVKTVKNSPKHKFIIMKETTKKKRKKRKRRDTYRIKRNKRTSKIKKIY